MEYLLLLLSLAVALQSAVATRPTTTTKLTGIYTFGDSFFDTGNNNHLTTTCRANHLPYGMDLPNRNATGRFSNGKLPGDILVSDLGIKDFLPAYLDKNRKDEELLTGITFASACSGLDDITAKEANVLNLDAQFANFQKAFQTMQAKFGTEKAIRAVENALLMISAGSNDMMDNYYVLLGRKIYTVDEHHEKLLTYLEYFVKNAGAKRLAVVGLPPLGCEPTIVALNVNLSKHSHECHKEYNSEIQGYNKKLKVRIKKMAAEMPKMRIGYMDVYNRMMEMIDKPKSFGFKATQKGCCRTGLGEVGPLCTVFAVTCQQRSEYMFFDVAHPTQATYEDLTKIFEKKVLPSML